MENAAVLEMDTSVRRGPATVKARRLFSDPAAAYPYKHLKYGLEEARMMKSDWVYRRGDLYLAADSRTIFGSNCPLLFMAVWRMAA